jgi:hypothetical protein
MDSEGTADTVAVQQRAALAGSSNNAAGDAPILQRPKRSGIFNSQGDAAGHAAAAAVCLLFTTIQSRLY